MDIVIDSSALLAVIMGEPERDRVIELTSGNTLIGPGPFHGRWAMHSLPC